MKLNVELLIGNEAGTKAYQPAVIEGIEWSTERKNAPGKLVFKVLKDDVLDFSEGSPVRMRVDGENVFLASCSSNSGQKTRSSRLQHMISCGI